MLFYVLFCGNKSSDENRIFNVDDMTTLVNQFVTIFQQCKHNKIQFKSGSPNGLTSSFIIECSDCDEKNREYQ